MDQQQSEQLEQSQQLQRPQVEINTFHTLQVRVFGGNYHQVTIDWSRTGFDGREVFIQLGQICRMPPNRSTKLYIWKNMRTNYALSMLTFVQDTIDQDASEAVGNICRRGVMDMLNTGNNTYVIATFLCIGSDRNLSVCYSLVHEDLIQDRCTAYFCQHAHTREMVNLKRNLIGNQYLNQALAQLLVPPTNDHQHLEQWESVFTRLNISQYLNMTCAVAQREGEIFQQEYPADIQHRQQG